MDYTSAPARADEFMSNGPLCAMNGTSSDWPDAVGAWRVNRRNDTTQEYLPMRRAMGWKKAILASLTTTPVHRFGFENL